MTNNSNNTPWAIEQEQNGWRLYYDGLRWPMMPRETEQEAREYLGRVRERYGSDSVARLMCGGE